jgi:hypothetical protein
MMATMRRIALSLCLIMLAARCSIAADAPSIAGDPPGSGKVGRFGDLSRLPIEGCKQVSEDRVRHALRRDVGVQVASAPAAPVSDFIAALRINLQAAYYSAGFPFATVNVRLDEAGNPVAVVVQEGDRFARGDVQVEGAKTLDAHVLVQMLTTAPPERFFQERIDPKTETIVIGGADESPPAARIAWEPESPAAFDPISAVSWTSESSGH